LKKNKIEEAIYIIDLKITKEVKENKLKNYKDFKDKIHILKEEKEKIYLGDEKIINKVFEEYLEEVKEGNRNV
jgi:hypothetical protein